MKVFPSRGVVCVLLALTLLPAVTCVAQKPDCAKPCTGLPGVTQEVQKEITDDGETCKLDPKYRECILAECLVTELPQAMLDFLKEQYGCDLSGASQRTASLVTLVLALVVVHMLK